MQNLGVFGDSGIEEDVIAERTKTKAPMRGMMGGMGGAMMKSAMAPMAAAPSGAVTLRDGGVEFELAMPAAPPDSPNDGVTG